MRLLAVGPSFPEHKGQCMGQAPTYALEHAHTCAHMCHCPNQAEGVLIQLRVRPNQYEEWGALNSESAQTCPASARQPHTSTPTPTHPNTHAYTHTHLNLAGTSDLQHSHAARQLGQALLQLLPANAHDKARVQEGSRWANDGLFGCDVKEVVGGMTSSDHNVAMQLIQCEGAAAYAR